MDLTGLKDRASKLMVNPSSSNVIKVVQEIVGVLEKLVEKKNEVSKPLVSSKKKEKK